MPLRCYVVAIFVGMQRATAICVNTGVALGRLRSPSDILTLPEAGSLVPLAALPWVARIGAGILHRSHRDGCWTRPRHGPSRARSPRRRPYGQTPSGPR
ncbi:MAG: hypothetical protein ACOY5U_15930 [Pseudomonadota bacterium]